MTREKIDLILRVTLTIILFVVPIVLTGIIWFTPEIQTNLFLVGVSTVNIILGLAEVMFLVRAVIFPKHGKKWWREW